MCGERNLHRRSTPATTAGSCARVTGTSTTTTATTAGLSSRPGSSNRMIVREQYDYSALMLAYMDCRKRKRNKRSAIAFETRFEARLDELLADINSGTYKIGPSTVFVVTDPKPREIWAAQFRDRIVHHLVYNDIAPSFEARWIEDTFSCIKGRGSLAAAKRLEKHHRRITQNYSRDCWYLQFDIKNFFVSISREKLWLLLSSRTGSDSLTARLLHQIVFNDPTQDANIKSGHLASRVPHHKSLWNAPPGRGLPIGNLTSQFFSNVYLDSLDQFIKHTLRAKFYARYVDDAIILGDCPRQLKRWQQEIDNYLRTQLGLELHPAKCRVARASQGINFVGYITKPWRRYARNSTVCKATCAARSPSGDSMRATNSYLGLLRHCNSYTIRQLLCRQAAIPAVWAYDKKFTKIIEL